MCVLLEAGLVGSGTVYGVLGGKNYTWMKNVDRDTLFFGTYLKISPAA